MGESDDSDTAKTNGNSTSQNTRRLHENGDDNKRVEQAPIENSKENEISSEHERQLSMISPGRPRNPVVVLIDDDEGNDDNPREASAPQSSDDVAVVKDQSMQMDTVTKESIFSNQGSFARNRKRRRRVALVTDDARDRPHLPPNQYETVLRRRAICKPEDKEETKANASPTIRGKSWIGTNKSQDTEGAHDAIMEGDDEEYGDISVGMKLNIIGGKVIVQRVNTLSDGRASPAQLTGLIQRGDVLLSIDNVSLVNLPLDQLLTGLKPLSAPHKGNCYKRSLHLRFAAGDGLKLLEKNETMKKPSADPTFAFSQYVTFVDQLSGLPMFEPETPKSEEPKAEPVVATPVDVIEPPLALQQGMSLDKIISVEVADFRKLEQQKYASEFFMWNEHFSGILRASAMLLSHEYADARKPMTFSEMMESGERAVFGAKALFHNMEDVDKGKDTRSFKKWNSTLSLRSRASARRRYVMKNVIALEEPLVEEEEPSDIDSVGSSTSRDADEPTGDDLLLQLAAHDEIWRRNVIEVLRNASKEIEEGEPKEQDAESSPERDPAGGSNEAPNRLESLLFGDEVSKMLTTKKQSHALPPEDVTSVLFDLMTNLTVTPDEISLNGSSHHVRPKSALVPFRERHFKGNENVMYAAKFLISDALPVWLKSFRPLPWEQRRILWPSNRNVTGGTSLASASYHIADDGLTVDSASTGFTSLGHRHHRKDLRQQIEDIELNEESRAET